MTEEQEERLVTAWESIARELGIKNEISRSVIAKKWPEPRPSRDVEVSRIPTEEDKIKAQSGNTDGPVNEWLGEFDAEEEIGPREKEFIARQVAAKLTASPKTSS